MSQSNTDNQHKDTIEPLLQFKDGLPAVLLEPHIEGRLKVMYNGEWIATVFPQFLDTGEEMSTGGQPYEILSHPDSFESYRGDAVLIARILSMLQEFEADWDKVGNAY